MFTMRSICLAAAALAVSGKYVPAAAQVAYEFDLTTAYSETNPFPNAVFLGGGTPDPDTSYVQIVNNGASTFHGRIAVVAVAHGGSDASSAYNGQTLAPGQAVSIAIGNEASNQGGFNQVRPNGTQAGARILLSGTVSDGTGSPVRVLLYTNDSQIHTATRLTSPCDGKRTDAYVLQGGSPTGCDNGDGYEESQPQGSFSFNGSVPRHPG